MTYLQLLVLSAVMLVSGLVSLLRCRYRYAVLHAQAHLALQIARAGLVDIMHWGPGDVEHASKHASKVYRELNDLTRGSGL